jgi:hypothetical protein
MSIITATNTLRRRPYCVRRARLRRDASLQLESLESRCLLSSSSTPTLPAGGVSHDAAGVGGSAALFTLTPQNDLYQHVPATGWRELGQDIIAFSASTETSGNVVVFALTSDHALARYDSTSGWQTIGAAGTIQSISSGTDQNGRADVYVATSSGLFTEYSGTYGWWSGPLGGAGTILSWDALSGDTVVAVTTSNEVVEHNDQFGWFPLSGPGFAQSVSAVTDNSGHLTVFATTAGGGLYRLATGSGWTAIGSGGTIAAVSAGTDQSGQAMAAVITTADDLLEYDATAGWFEVHPPGPVAEATATTGDLIYFTLQDGSVFGHDDQFGSFRMTSVGFAAT